MVGQCGVLEVLPHRNPPYTYNPYCLKPTVSPLRLPLWTQGMAIHIKWSKDKNMNISLLKHKANGPENQLRTLFYFEIVVFVLI